ncbi:lipase [Ascosphaera apis ARSEF 7405]|uniref:Carboxylic ester hydrolase n=1 Tax=Ascosphaera apis ARSEF 7405 TaxID=392613 RepID=A0A167Y0H7_9EURO|nr:lipase [Ascosphaera apis ARSEF 7405]
MIISRLISVISLAAAANAGLLGLGTPTVVIPSPDATITGAASAGVDAFKGIPFAVPPVGRNRLKPPQPITQSMGSIHASEYGPACPQLYFSVEYDEGVIPTDALGRLMNTPIFQRVANNDEDCLTLHIWRPSNVKPGAKLPVLFWIFGGGFEIGASSQYDGTQWVQTSIRMGQPIIFIAVSYRVGGFGFLPGKEIKEAGAGNLGLLDQRLGLQWVSDNIESFGGDPDKVTIWGESAGAISVFEQMMLYGGNNTYKNRTLFRAGIMNSGSLVPAQDIDSPKAQHIFNTVATKAGCQGQKDVVECLRSLDYTTFLNACNSVRSFLSYGSVALSYVPRPDGLSLPESPDILVKSGRFARVPMIIGDQEDEGTVFSFTESNITNHDELVGYVHDYYFNDGTWEVMNDLVNQYNDTAENGSPFRTGHLNNIYPEFKRISALLGDVVFTLTRRVMLNLVKSVDSGIKTWTYLATYDYGLPILGTFHGSDIIQVMNGVRDDYAARGFKQWYISFVNHLDPNKGKDAKYLEWPEWTPESPHMVNVAADSASLMTDDFRSGAYNVINDNVEQFRV